MTNAAPLLGRKVAGRFTIKRVLGEGGMAVVYVAEQDGEPREIALKIMNEELTADKTFVKRFDREAKAASLVVHPNCVRILDYGVDGPLSYIAMELLVGKDVFILLDRGGPFSQQRTARILADVTDALEVAHDLGIVHRDLKPENIMVCPDPAAPNGERVKVLDFGIAKLVAPEQKAEKRGARFGSDSALTNTGTLIGTPSYMSPEQCGLQAVDTRSDIYTCGVLLYQLLTGKLPFEGEAPLHTAMLHIHEPPRRPSEIAPDLDPRLEAVVLKALEKKPEDRYQTAKELGTTLRALVDTLPVGPAAPPSKPKRAIAAVPDRAPPAAAPPPRAPPAAPPRPPPPPPRPGGPPRPAPKKHPETLRWSGEAPAEPPLPVARLQAARTLIGSGVGLLPPSVLVRDEPDSAPTHVKVDAEPEVEELEPSTDPADRAATLIRVGEAAKLEEEIARRSGPYGTAVMPAISDLHTEPSPRREPKLTLRSADGFKGPDATPSSSVKIAIEESPTEDSRRGALPAMPATSAVQVPKGPPQTNTLPMGMMPDLLDLARTIPVAPKHVPRLGTSTIPMQIPIQAMEPFPITRARPAGSVNQMSNARVLVLGFLAGVVVMGLVTAIYFGFVR